MIESFKYSETELRVLAYQYAILILKEPRLIQRIPYPKITGKPRIIIHLLKLLIGTLRYGDKQQAIGKYDGKSICFTASTNQLFNAQRVFKNNQQVEIIHFPGSKIQATNENLMVMNFSLFIRYFGYLLKRLQLHKIEIRKVLMDNNKCFDYLCDIFFVEFFLNFTRINAKKVFINTDLSAFGNVTGKFFLNQKVEVIYLPHSPLLKLSTPVYYNKVVCHSVNEIEERQQWLAGQGISDVEFTLLENNISIGSGTGILIKPEDKVAEIEKFINEIQGDLYLRPHPMMSNTIKWKNLSKKLNISFSDPISESTEQFLSKIQIVVGRISGTHKEILDLGGSAYIVSPKVFTDNYDILSQNNSIIINSWEEAAKRYNSNRISIY